MSRLPTRIRDYCGIPFYLEALVGVHRSHWFALRTLISQLRRHLGAWDHPAGFPCNVEALVGLLGFLRFALRTWILPLRWLHGSLWFFRASSYAAKMILVLMQRRGIPDNMDTYVHFIRIRRNTVISINGRLGVPGRRNWCCCRGEVFRIIWTPMSILSGSGGRHSFANSCQDMYFHWIS